MSETKTTFWRELKLEFKRRIDPLGLMLVLFIAGGSLLWNFLNLNP